jgi:hypothetical protein
MVFLSLTADEHLLLPVGKPDNKTLTVATEKTRKPS